MEGTVTQQGHALTQYWDRAAPPRSVQQKLCEQYQPLLATAAVMQAFETEPKQSWKHNPLKL